MYFGLAKQGTNSHDRRLGADAVVRSRLDRGAIGLVTTHDLALTHLAEVLAPQAVNMHFADQINGEKYRACSSCELLFPSDRRRRDGEAPAQPRNLTRSCKESKAIGRVESPVGEGWSIGANRYNRRSNV